MIKGLNITGNKDGVMFVDVNTVKFVDKGLTIGNNGRNNVINIGRNVVFNNFQIRVDCNNSIIDIEDDCRLTGNVVMKLTDGNKLFIGRRTTVGGANFICGEKTSIIIGEDCMIAWGIEFRTTDSHAIYDLDSKQRINNAADIKISDHVWIGAHTTLLKGSAVAQGSVVSIKSVVTKAFDVENVVIAGAPAKIVRQNVYWERPLLG